MTVKNMSETICAQYSMCPKGVPIGKRGYEGTLGIKRTLRVSAFCSFWNFENRTSFGKATSIFMPYVTDPYCNQEDKTR